MRKQTPRNISTLLSAANAINGLLALSQLVRNEDDAEECNFQSFVVVDILIEDLADDMQGLDFFADHVQDMSQEMCALYLYTKLRRASGDSWDTICFDSSLATARSLNKLSYHSVMGVLMAMEEEINNEEVDIDQALVVLKKLALRKHDSETTEMIVALVKAIDPSTTHLRTMN